MVYNSTETKKAALASVSSKSSSKGQMSGNQILKQEDISRLSEHDYI